MTVAYYCFRLWSKTVALQQSYNCGWRKAADIFAVTLSEIASKLDFAFIIAGWGAELHCARTAQMRYIKAECANGQPISSARGSRYWFVVKILARSNLTSCRPPENQKIKTVNVKRTYTESILTKWKENLASYIIMPFPYKTLC